MINRKLARITLTLLLISGSFTAGAQPRGRSIHGRVQNSSGVDMPWIIVRLLKGDGSSAGLTVTNNAGEFSFNGLNATSYTVSVAAPDYDPAIRQVRFDAGADAANTSDARTVEVKLSPGSNAGGPSRPAFTQNVPEAARAVFDRAMKMGKAGKKQVANTLMREAVRVFPEYFDAHFALSNELLKAGRISEAIAELDLARTINPNDDRVYQLFGVALIELKRYDVAAAVFAEAFRLNTAEPLHLLMRASALLDYASAVDPSSSKETAIEWYDALSEADRNLTRAYNLSGKQLAAVHLHRARLYEKKGENARAASELEQYLAENPTSKRADAIRDEIQKLRQPFNTVKPASPPR
jgi:tetratricopeptide (TPR) repeat protein